ncbi:MAG TPA: MerR family transcriptional regulator [Candidatus Phocaeicola excrementigallinarum]|nr:MerR family transcriptional regulator [Candidatus Phocaeicola excrementigallinarum]
MAYNANKDLKLFYSISEVAKMFDVNESLLRYWEKEFPIISPKKAGHSRQYRKEDIENIRMVYYLVKEKGMTLAGAKQRLKQSKSAVASDSEIVRRLKVVRDELARMRQELDYIT